MKSHAQIRVLFAVAFLALTVSVCTSVALSKFEDGARPGARVLMDAHNCYPYFGWWSDRIERALSAGTPLAIEQDLLWFTDPKTGAARSMVAHDASFSGAEPSLREYFFERVRPIAEKALKNGNRGGLAFDYPQP